MPRSGTWIYSQIDALARGDKYRPIAIAKRLENRPQFPFEPVYSIDDKNLIFKGWQRLYKKQIRPYFPAHLKALQHENARLLHSHMGDRALDDAALAQAAGIPHVATFYGADVWLACQRVGWRAEFQNFARGASAMLAEGNAMRAKMIEEGAPPEKVEVFHLGVDLEKIEFAPRAPSSDGEIRLLMAGRPLEKKGHIFGLRAFALLASKYPQLHLELLIGGRDGKSGAIADELKKCIAECGLENRITWDEFLPYDEYLRRLKRAQIFVQPSVHAQSGDAEGGFPVTILEMSASGMPIVATTHCDIPEAVLDGESGLIGAERDVTKLAEKIEWLIQHPESWEKMGRVGRAHVQANYNITQQGKQLEAIYDRVLGR
jgi:colanic acid/amylovoran biosynthesis glycosyltransferase